MVRAFAKLLIEREENLVREHQNDTLTHPSVLEAHLASMLTKDAVSARLKTEQFGKPEKIADSARRTIYGFIDRKGLSSLYRSFDFPSPSFSAAMRSRNTQVSVLYMHCLSRNSTMMHIAKKSGMKIEYAYGEADAYLTLAPADQSTILAEMLQEQAAVIDYALKREARRTSKLLETLLPTPEVA